MSDTDDIRTLCPHCGGAGWVYLPKAIIEEEIRRLWSAITKLENRIAELEGDDGKA